MQKPKAVLLFSGGLDSTTVLAYAQQQGFDVYPLSFDYGQKHVAELTAAKRVATAFGVHLNIVTLALGTLTGSALTDADKDITNFSANKKIPTTYVPARNTVFLSLALAYAEVLGVKDIFIGVSSVDYSGYPDCRPEFITAFEVLANVATKMGVEGERIRLHTPLMHLSKAATVQLGQSLGVDYALTVSCYRAQEATGEACGLCDSCVLRKQGFQQAGVADPTRYVPID
jgi:7-cyano-7-deazaguanine synthase